jgi:Uma2 family endonuclease
MSMTVMPFVPLDSGDHLDVEEFHRRYCARPDIKRAELVEGVVYVGSPVGPLHAEPHAAVVGWLSAYQARHPDLNLMDNVSLRPGGENEVQPDACLFRGPPIGNVRYVGNQYIEDVPELVVEVAVSSVSYDMFEKLRMYERAGVPEYVVWQVHDQRIIWFRLQDGRYLPVEPDERGVIESSVFPGLRLAVATMLAGDNAGVLAELERQQERDR